MNSSPVPLSGWRLFGATLLVLFVTAAARVAAAMLASTLGGRTTSPETDGLVVGAAILGASVVGGAVLYLVLRQRDAASYLALRRPTPMAVATAIGLSALTVVIFDAARFATTGSVVPPVWLEIYRTGPLALLVVAFAVAAPIFEESFFRGFLHHSLVPTRFGVPGTIALVAVLFTLAHGAEDVVSVLDVLTSAVLLGVLRHKFGSIVPGIAAHAFGNLQAIVTAALLG